MAPHEQRAPYTADVAIGCSTATASDWHWRTAVWDGGNVELHGYCDASAVYGRAVDGSVSKNECGIFLVSHDERTAYQRARSRRRYVSLTHAGAANAIKACIHARDKHATIHNARTRCWRNVAIASRASELYARRGGSARARAFDAGNEFLELTEVGAKTGA